MKKTAVLFLILISVLSCQSPNGNTSDKLKIVTTTTIITDLVRQIAGDNAFVDGLMGPGVDPHLYKASEGDVTKLAGADLIFYNGLHLEGKMTDIFQKMENQGKQTCNLGNAISPELLHASKNFGGNYDPHVWFSVPLFKVFAEETARVLSEASPEHKDIFEANLKLYLSRLDSLDSELHDMARQLSADKRKLVTAHDAFGYFGDTYGFEVVGLQGISTATEAGVQDVRNVVEYVVQNQIKSIFIESSVPKRTIEALRQAVLSKGHSVEIGGTLYSDALGTEGSPEETYIGMFRYNMQTITDGLK